MVFMVSMIYDVWGMGTGRREKGWNRGEDRRDGKGERFEGETGEGRRERGAFPTGAGRGETGESAADAIGGLYVADSTAWDHFC